MPRRWDELGGGAGRAAGRRCTSGRRRRRARRGRCPSGWRRRRRAGRRRTPRRRSGCGGQRASRSRPGDRKRLAGLDVGATAALVVGLGDDADAAHHLARRGQLQAGAEQPEVPGRRVLVRRRGEQSESGGGGGGRAGEDERHLVIAVVPGRNGGVADQCSGVGGDGRPEQRDPRGGGRAKPRDPSGQRAGRSHAGYRHVGTEQPRADAHRRADLEHPEHVREARGPAQVMNQRHHGHAPGAERARLRGRRLAGRPVRHGYAAARTQGISLEELTETRAGHMNLASARRRASAPR
jgi:hypothetical protein